MIVREPGRDRWVVIDQAVIRNRTLSLRARGLLALLLSMPDDWAVNSEWIATQTTEGRDAIRVAMTELEHAGHMQRHKQQDDKGHWRTYTVVYEQPVDIRGTGDGIPGVGQSGAIRSTYKETFTVCPSNMLTEQLASLCTTCDATGWQTTAPGHPSALTRCDDCRGTGTHGTKHR